MQEHISELQSSYNTSWLKFLFRFSAFGRLLQQKTTPNPYDLLNTYFSSGWLTRLWSRSLIKSISMKREFNFIINLSNELKKRGLFNQENINIINTNKFMYIDFLRDANLLTQENLTLIKLQEEKFSKLQNSESYRSSYFDILNNLSYTKMLDNDTFKKVLQFPEKIPHPNEKYILRAMLKYLETSNVKIITKENFMIVADYLDTLNALQKLEALSPLEAYSIRHNLSQYDFVRVLYTLTEAEIPIQDYFTQIMERKDPETYAEVLSTLIKAEIPTANYLEKIMQLEYPIKAATILSILKQANLFNEKNIDSVFSRDIERMLTILQKLQTANISTEGIYESIINKDIKLFDLHSILLKLQNIQYLNQDSFKKVLDFKVDCLNDALSSLYTGKILTSQNFDSLLSKDLSVIITPIYIYSWRILSDRGINQIEFDKLLEASRQTDADAALKEAMLSIINPAASKISELSFFEKTTTTWLSETPHVRSQMKKK